MVGSLRQEEPKECFRIEGANKASARELLKIRCLPVLLAIYFLVMAGFSFFYIAFPIHAVKGLAWSVTQTGAFFATLSLLMVVVQGPILARAAKILSDQTLVICGSLILSLGFVLFVSGETALVYLGAALTALGNGLMWPSVMSRLAKRAGQVYQGAVQGFASSLGAVAGIVGLVAGGLLYNWLGPWVFSASALTALIVCGLAASLGFDCRGATPGGLREDRWGYGVIEHFELTWPLN